MIINNRLVYYSIASSAILSLILTFFPDIDINFSKLFYIENNGFIYKDISAVNFLFLSIPFLTKMLFFSLLLFLLYNLIKHKKIKRQILFWNIYILITVVIGPGLIVNYVFKENVGRARPIQAQDFGGNKEFSRAFIVSDQCSHNCSFSSGHAAMGYYFTAFAYIFPIIYFSKIYIAGLLFGSLIGLSRILMGGHFLSDVTTSCLVILIINHILYLALKNSFKN